MPQKTDFVAGSFESVGLKRLYFFLLLHHRDRVWKIDYCKSVAEQGSAGGYALDAEEKEIDQQELKKH